MNNSKTSAGLLLGVLTFSTIVSATAAQPAASEVLSLSQQELANLVKPAVVRIIQHNSGEATIPEFDIDLYNLSVAFVADGKPLKIPLDEYFSGSGFVVNPTGYILTNSHVASDMAVKQEIVGQLIAAAIFDKLAKLNPEEKIAVEASLRAKGIDKFDQDTIFDVVSKILDSVVANSQFKISKIITVLKPTSTEDRLKELVKDGFPAEIISINDRFFFDDRDVALIKIEEQNLPVLKLGPAEPLTTGQKIHVFGFPSTAQVSGGDFLEATFTQGVVSAIKDTRDQSFRFYQTDAKVSTGSSGGPLFNERGEVVGIVTFQSGNLGEGDNFASAIPIELGQRVLTDHNVTNDPGQYQPNFQEGLALLREKRCRRALEEFKLAGLINEQFGAEQYLRPYIEECNKLIAAGESIDSQWDEFRQKLQEQGPKVWLLAGGGFLLVAAAGFIILRLVKRVNAEEKKIDNLEYLVEGEQAMAGEPGVNVGLIKYVIDARAASMTDVEITGELRKTGWGEADIESALKSPK